MISRARRQVNALPAVGDLNDAIATHSAEARIGTAWACNVLVVTRAAMVEEERDPVYSAPMGVTNTRLRGSGQTHRGHVRDDNQDAIIVEPDLGLYAVLDGMGGANAGDVAARLAAQEIVACIRKSRIRRRSPHKLLALALDTAAIRVFTAAHAQFEYLGMGTTVVACLVVDSTRAVIGHAGDSRAYLLRDGHLTALTRDHTSAPNRLTRNLGREHGVEPDVVEVPLKPADRLLLCSDGLYGGAPMRAIRRVLSSAAPELVAHRLVARVLKGEASDNVSAVVIAVDGGRARAAGQRPSSRAQTRRSRPSEPRRARR